MQYFFLQIDVTQHTNSAGFFNTWENYFLALISIIANVCIAIWAKKETSKKELSCIIKAANIDINTNLFTNYLGKQIASLTSKKLEFINTGNQPIKSIDFDTPIFIKIKSSETNCLPLLDAKFDYKTPSNISATISLAQNTATISSCLLNKLDRFQVQLFFDSQNSLNYKVQVDVRIDGIEELNYFFQEQDEKMLDYFFNPKVILISSILAAVISLTIIIFQFVS